MHYIRGKWWKFWGQEEAMGWIIVMLYCALLCHVGGLSSQAEQVCWFFTDGLCVCFMSGCLMITCLKMDSWDHRYFPLHAADPVLHVSWTGEKRVCGHIYWLSLRAFDGSYALSWYYCILVLIAMFMVFGLWWEEGQVHIGTQIPLLVNVSKNNLEHACNILK